MRVKLVASMRILFVALCAVLISSPEASANLGDRFEEVKKTDFFIFFNLVEVGKTSDPQQNDVIAFRPRGAKFRELTLVHVKVDKTGLILEMTLTLGRAFLNHEADGLFARDMTKSFLLSAVPVSDLRAINDLVNEIQFPRESNAMQMIHKKPPPELPAKPTPGYLVYLGKGNRHEERLSQGILRLENMKDDEGDRLFISVLLRSAIAETARSVEQRAKDACAKICVKLNAILESKFLAVCFPASDTKGGPPNAFMIFAQDVFKDEKIQRDWIAAVVISSGWAILELPEVRGMDINRIITADLEDLRRSLFTEIPASSVKDVSRQFFSGKIKTLEEVYYRISPVLKN